MIMTVEEFLNQNHCIDDWSVGEESLKDSLWTNNVLKYMKEFALLKCAEQREICADEFFNLVDREVILKTSNPEM